MSLKGKLAKFGSDTCEDIAPKKWENLQTSVKFHEFEELISSLIFNKSF